MFDWVLNTPLIFKRLREKLFHVKITSSIMLNHSSRGICSLCKFYVSLLKVIFSSISFVLNLWTKCSSVICITISNTFSAAVDTCSTCILNKVTWRYINISKNVFRNFSAISFTCNMSVICCNSHEEKTCWKCILLFKSSNLDLSTNNQWTFQDIVHLIYFC